MPPGTIKIPGDFADGLNARGRNAAGVQRND